MRAALVWLWVCGFLIGFGLGGLFAISQMNLEWRAETVARGLALYCPESGQWAWVGECGE
jgi:hypothetical protein